MRVPIVTKSEPVQANERQRSKQADEARTPTSISESSSNQSVPDYDIATVLNSYDKPTLVKLLVKVAEDPDKTAFASSIRQKYHQKMIAQRAAEASRPIYFTKVAQEVAHAIYEEHCKKKSSEQYEAAFNVSETVRDAIKSITKQVKPHSAFDTKKSALASLRSIAESTIGEGAEEIGRRMRMDLGMEGMSRRACFMLSSV